MNPEGARISPAVLSSHELWVESDRQRDAARSLEMVNAQLVSAAVDPRAWAWVILTVQHATRAFVTAGSEAPGADAISSPLRGLRLRLRNDPAGFEDSDLVGSYRRVVENAGLTAFPAVVEDLDRLIRLHQQINERMPPGWALRLNDLPRTVRSCLKSCEQLGWSPGVIRWEDPRNADHARAKYVGAIRILEALDAEYGEG